MKRVVVALATCVIAMAARGAADSNAAERARIRDERAQAQRLFEERQRGCSERFAVTSCLEAARAQRREAMDRLRQQELVLDDAERKQRAAARVTRIREKESSQESKPSPIVRERTAPTPKPALKGSPAASSSASASSAVPRISDEQARRNKEAFDEKQKQAAEHRADVERRNAQRLQKTKPKAPLPVPKAVSAP